ncbi:very long chain fatty acid elongase 6-like isoform X2 [Branchiostoma floridae x Branchiostoma japonicum]
MVALGLGQKGRTTAGWREMADTNVTFQHVPPPFTFEKDFDGPEFHLWFSNVWKSGYVLAAAYVVLVWAGRWYMEERPAYNMRSALAIWSACLSVFSIMGALRLNAVWLHDVRERGLTHSLCDGHSLTAPISGFWAVAFTLSKAVEFGDTFFIVARKQKLIFLHWYHHALTLVAVWYQYVNKTGPALFFMCMNFSVHALMYPYYTLRASRVRVPKSVAMVITTLQVLQMITGLAVIFYVYGVVKSGRDCDWSDESFYMMFVVYGSFAVLFLNFFMKSYLSKPARDKKE